MPVGDAGTPCCPGGSSPGPNCVPVSTPGGSRLAWGLASPAQCKDHFSLGVELVARPILGGPPAYLAWS